MTNRHIVSRGLSLLGALAVTLAGVGGFAGEDSPILSPLSATNTIASTVPSNGDVNPYGVAKVKGTVGNLQAVHFLLSNFNKSTNLQGTGTTIVDVAPSGSFSLFAEINPAALPDPCPGGVELTTALVVLRSGWVIAGSLPTTDGMPDTIGAGCLIVLDSLNNRIAATPNALTRTTSAGTGMTLPVGGRLNDPLGLVVVPNHHILTVNGNDGFITEITPQGAQIAKKLLGNTAGPPSESGTLFGLDLDPDLGVVFVDDGSNTLNVLH